MYPEWVVEHLQMHAEAPSDVPYEYKPALQCLVE